MAFETPILLVVLALALAGVVMLRWRHRRPDEWREEQRSPSEPEGGPDLRR